MNININYLDMRILGMKHKAFSLIEMSVVMLIISVLIAGIMKSRKLSAKAKIANASNLTLNSPVASLGNLVLWYETTMEQSFDSTEAINGTKISTWYDLNPKIETVRNNATQTIETNKPTYKINKINGLPAISFSRAGQQYMLFKDGSPIVNSEYTIFIVGQRSDNGANVFIGSRERVTNSNLRIGYRSDTLITVIHWNNGITAICPSYTTPTPVIFSATFNFSKRNLYLNGALQTNTPIGSSSNETTPLISYNGAGLAASDDYLEGDIGEVIIFKTFLKTEERKAIEIYLSKKWGIKL